MGEFKKILTRRHGGRGHEAGFSHEREERHSRGETRHGNPPCRLDFGPAASECGHARGQHQRLPESYEHRHGSRAGHILRPGPHRRRGRFMLRDAHHYAQCEGIQGDTAAFAGEPRCDLCRSRCPLSSPSCPKGEARAQARGV